MTNTCSVKCHIPTRLPYNTYYSPVMVPLAIGPIFGLGGNRYFRSIQTRVGSLDPVLAMIGDRVS